MTVSDDDIANLLNEELYARRVKVLFLSNAGATIAKIAEECGVSSGTVRKDLEIAKRQYLAETPDQRRAVQMSIIHDMRKANYPAMMRGDADAANIILRGLKQEASLFGLFPKVLEVPGIDSISAANEAAALIERIAAIDPQGLKEITRGQTPLDVEFVDSQVESATGATPFDAARPGAPVLDPVTARDGTGPDVAGDTPGVPRSADDAGHDTGIRGGGADVARPDVATGGPDDGAEGDDDGWSNIGS